MAHAVRIYRPGTEEYDAARRLLTSLGPLAVDPLLEQLAEEPDMSVRKSLVDVLSEMAPVYFNEIGSHVSDARWFVVRNVVAILGSTHSSAMLPYLERTLRHHEVRVRRETIRALSGIHDRVAHEMLVHALTDDDAQNVQLAARYLGAAKVDCSDSRARASGARRRPREPRGRSAGGSDRDARETGRATVASRPRGACGSSHHHRRRQDPRAGFCR